MIIFSHIDTSTVFQGDGFNINISSSFFESFSLKNSIAGILDSKNSDITISNTEFMDIK